MKEFYNLLFKQLENLFFLNEEEKQIINKYSINTNERFLYNCIHIKNKYYENLLGLSPYHSCQYTMFLYMLSNTIFKAEQNCIKICDKIYNLSKIVSGADIYYEINLPEIFMFDHPTGTVLGRAEYSDGFSFSQGCSVGNNKGIYPKFGKNVALMANSTVLGNCRIGDNVIISANTYIKDTDIPDYSIVFGSDKNLIIKEFRKEKSMNFFNAMFKEM